MDRFANLVKRTAMGIPEGYGRIGGRAWIPAVFAWGEFAQRYGWTLEGFEDLIVRAQRVEQLDVERGNYIII